MKPELRAAFKRDEYNAVLDIQCAERISVALTALRAKVDRMPLYRTPNVGIKMVNRAAVLAAIDEAVVEVQV